MPDVWVTLLLNAWMCISLASAEGAETLAAESPATATASAIKPSVTEEQIAKWVQELSSDSYLRRKRASTDLTRVGQRAVRQLVAELDSGELETTERVISILQEIAAEAPIVAAQTQSPSGADKGELSGASAWEELVRISTLGGSRGSRAKVALDEVRAVRREHAIAILLDAGVFIGISEFIVGSRSEQKRIVEFDDDFHGSDETLNLLQWIDEIEFARVKGKSIRKEVLEGVVQMPNLKTLALVQGKIDSVGLRALGAISELRRLELRYVPMSGELIDQLATLPIRVSLTLNGTAAPPERVAALQETVPGLEIIFKQGGFLGVKCFDNFNECLINEVVSGQGAEQAGLLPGDVVLEVDGQPIKQFKDLQKAIDAHLPGEKIEIRYKRGGSERETTAQLGKLAEQ